MGARIRLPVERKHVRQRGGGGHLEVLQWARANSCPWDWQTCANAAWGGHLDVLNGQSKTVPRARGIRARTRRGADTSRCCSFCARAGAWNARMCAWLVADAGHFDVFKWTIENGCP